MRRALLLLLALSALAALAGAPVTRGEDPAKAEAGAFLDTSLSGWEGLIRDYWSYKDGALVGNTFPKGLKFNTFLCSKKKYKDFELSFKIRLKGGAGNSGVQIRSSIANTKTFAVKGPQCDIGAGYWGSLYGELFGGMMQAAPKESQKTVKKDDFNDYYIKAVGQHVTIKLNGETTVDQKFDKAWAAEKKGRLEMPAEGIIAWQLHAGGPMEVTFKDIKFKELKAKE
jgi:hypothetical protein